MRKITQKVLAIVSMSAMVLLNTISPAMTAQAATTIDPNAKGSITVTKLSNEGITTINGTGLEQTVPGAIAVPGATYKITQTHKLDGNGNIVLLEAGDTPSPIEDITDAAGIIEFTSLALGRYELVETEAPEGFQKDPTVYQIDVPLFDEDGELMLNGGSPIYDVYVYPKNTPFSAEKAQRPGGSEAEYETTAGQKIQIGDLIEYQIKTSVPQDILDGVIYEKMSIVDKMDIRLDYVTDSGEFYILRDNVRTSLSESDYTIVYDDASNTLTATITNKDFIATLRPSTDKLVLDFTARVNEKALVDGTDISNTAIIDFENEDGTHNTTTTPPTTSTLDKGEITINKVDSATKAGLNGAKFQLYRSVDDLMPAGTQTEEITVNGQTVTVYAVQEVVTSANQGIAKWGDLPAGHYYAVETEAPTGYNKLVEAIDLGVLTTGTITAEAEVQNVRKGIIPQTGGIGTTLFTLGGVVIMIAAVFMVFRKKQKTA